MADVHIERKESGGIPAWAWVLALVAAAVAVWWIASAMAGRPVAGPIETAVTQPLVNAGGEDVVPTTEPNTPGAVGAATDNDGAAAGATENAGARVEPANANLPLAAILANPGGYYNKWVSGMGTVAEVMSDRVFRVEQDGTYMTVVKAENIVETTNVTEGGRVSFSGMVVDPAEARSRVPSLDRLSASNRQMLQGGKAFIHATNIEMQNR